MGYVGPNSLLKVCDSQEFTFHEDVIISMNKKAKKDDHEGRRSIRKKRRTQRDPKMEVMTVEGYMGKPKGLQQILYEQGLLDDTTKDKKTIMTKLGACPDFANEVSQIQYILRKHDHIVGLTP